MVQDKVGRGPSVLRGSQRRVRVEVEVKNLGVPVVIGHTGQWVRRRLPALRPGAASAMRLRTVRGPRAAHGDALTGCWSGAVPSEPGVFVAVAHCGSPPPSSRPAMSDPGHWVEHCFITPSTYHWKDRQEHDSSKHSGAPAAAQTAASHAAEEEPAAAAAWSWWPAVSAHVKPPGPEAVQLSWPEQMYPAHSETYGIWQSPGSAAVHVLRSAAAGDLSEAWTAGAFWTAKRQSKVRWVVSSSCRQYAGTWPVVDALGPVRVHSRCQSIAIEKGY